jgi:hypothetical protein
MHHDPTLPLYLFTDASGVGVGAILSHVRDKIENPIAFYSRTLNQYERKIRITKKELLAIIFGISKTREFIYGKHFYIVTDHKALKHILGFKDPHGRLARWSIYLSQFNFTVIYGNGRKHTNCDVLSRNPLQDQIPETQDTDLEGFLSVMDEVVTVIPFNLQREQLKDKFCQEVEKLLKSKDKRAKKYSFNEEELLTRTVITPYEKRTLLVLPKSILKQAIMGSHDPPSAGHQGFSRMQPD